MEREEAKVTIKVMLVDDHEVVRKGLLYLLAAQSDMEVVGEAGQGQAAVSLAKILQPDVVLMDLIMPGMDGIEAIQQLRGECPNTKVIVLTSFSGSDHVLPAIRAGAQGYLLKDVHPDELIRAIRGVHQGHAQLHPSATDQLMAHVTSPVQEKPGKGAADELTPRELEVLRHIAGGMSNKEIAAAFGIAEKTVKTHVTNLLSKLGLADRTQAAVYAVRNGLADPE
jgi:DNA-binding NarL/FixJ family response regulator